MIFFSWSDNNRIIIREENKTRSKSPNTSLLGALSILCLAINLCTFGVVPNNPTSVVDFCWASHIHTYYRHCALFLLFVSLTLFISLFNYVMYMFLHVHLHILPLKVSIFHICDEFCIIQIDSSPHTHENENECATGEMRLDAFELHIAPTESPFGKMYTFVNSSS